MEEILLQPVEIAQDSGTSALRAVTQTAHRQVEEVLALPQSIRGLYDYNRWLIRFLGIYEPLETLLAAFTQWQDWDIRLEDLGHVESLKKDTRAMHLDLQEIDLAPQHSLPQLHSFSEAFGALYVIEGSKLGGRFILRDLSARLGSEIDGATAFFQGHGEQAGASWNAFKHSLDAFLFENSGEFPRVAAGAKSTFASIQAWMTPVLQAGQS